MCGMQHCVTECTFKTEKLNTAMSSLTTFMFWHGTLMWKKW